MFLETLSLPGKKEWSPVIGYGQVLVREVDTVLWTPPSPHPSPHRAGASDPTL